MAVLIPVAALAAAIGIGVLLGVRSAGGPDAPPPVAQTTPSVATPTTPPPPVAAKELFAENCGTCHTLADAGSTAGIGPDLDRIRPSRATVRAMIANGSLSGIMPAGLLVGEEAERVAAYVARVAGRG